MASVGVDIGSRARFQMMGTQSRMLGRDRPPERRRDLVVIGGSAGALEPLKEIVAGLPADLPAAVAVVIHMGPTQPTMLGPILNRGGGPPAITPREGDPATPGYVYVATPDRHLEVGVDGIHLGCGPRINGARPSIDVLFQSAAHAYGSRTIGVVLSGGLDDGSAGLAAIRQAGGIGIVQRPEEAVAASMPRSAILRAHPQHVASAGEIARLIVDAVNEEAPERGSPAPKGEGAMPDDVAARDIEGTVTGLTCPECHGAIWMRSDPALETFSCRVGHMYSPETFFEIQAEYVENALWAGVRSLEEQASYARVMSARAERLGDERGREQFEARRRVASANAEILRNVVAGRD